MKPDYERYRANRTGSEFKGCRLPTALVAQIERLAEIEGDSFTGMVIEGLARIVEDRLGADGFAERAAAIRAEAEARIAALQALADEARAEFAPGEPPTSKP